MTYLFKAYLMYTYTLEYFMHFICAFLKGLTDLWGGGGKPNGKSAAPHVKMLTRTVWLKHS